MALTRLGPNQSVNLASNVTGTLPIANGGTALTSGFVNGGVNTPAFSVTQGSGQDLANATATKLAFNTEVFDTDSAFDHSSNYRFTVPSGEAGKYFFYAQATLQATQDADANSIFFYKNGSSFQSAMNTNQYYDTSEISIVMDLSAGDYIEVYFEHNRGTTDDVANGRWYGCKLIT